MKNLILFTLAVFLLAACETKQVVPCVIANDCPDIERGIVLDATAFLGGALSPDKTSMRNDINALLPLEQPFASSPYQYFGEERIKTPFTGIVDWVYVEVRMPHTGESVAGQAALLMSDGRIVNTDLRPLEFDVPKISYNVVVAHRNHLDVISGTPVDFTDTRASVDFTSGVSVWEGMIRVSNSHFAMIPGDVNWDQRISFVGKDNDNTPIIRRLGTTVNVLKGYYSEDINMNGVVSYRGNANDSQALLETVLGGDMTNVIYGQLSN